jgi:hypothetical protein
MVRRKTGGFDFSGPYFRGDHADRHLFLAWGDVHEDGTLQLIRGSKLKLTVVDPRINHRGSHAPRLPPPNRGEAQRPAPLTCVSPWAPAGSVATVLAASARLFSGGQLPRSSRMTLRA